MSCIQDESLLERYLDGELPEPLVRRVEDALEACEHCRSLVAQAEAIRGALKTRHAEVAASAPVDAMWSRIEAALAEAPAAPPAATLLDRLARWWASLADRRLEVAIGATAVVLAAVVGVWVLRTASITPEPAAPETAVAPAAPDNTLIVESYEVSEGTVVIDQDLDDTGAPTVVWHFSAEDADGGLGGG